MSDDLLDWLNEADGFSQGTKAPHKWVLQAEQEIRMLRARVAELEGEDDFPVSDCMRAMSAPVTAESFAQRMRAVSDAQDRAAMPARRENISMTEAFKRWPSLKG